MAIIQLIKMDFNENVLVLFSIQYCKKITLYYSIFKYNINNKTVKALSDNFNHMKIVCVCVRAHACMSGALNKEIHKDSNLYMKLSLRFGKYMSTKRIIKLPGLVDQKIFQL